MKTALVSDAWHLLGWLIPAQDRRGNSTPLQSGLGQNNTASQGIQIRDFNLCIWDEGSAGQLRSRLWTGHRLAPGNRAIMYDSSMDR